MIELAVVAGVAAICGGFIGHWMGKNPGQAVLLEGFAQQEFAKLRTVVDEEIARLRQQATPPTPSAPTVAAAPPPVAWTLGESYPSVGALSLDIQGAGFKRQINVDGDPVFNVGGPDPVAFYRVGAAVTQTKP